MIRTEPRIEVLSIRDLLCIWLKIYLSRIDDYLPKIVVARFEGVEALYEVVMYGCLVGVPLS